jgi:hypothetical protein
VNESDWLNTKVQMTDDVCILGGSTLRLFISYSCTIIIVIAYRFSIAHVAQFDASRNEAIGSILPFKS